MIIQVNGSNGVFQILIPRKGKKTRDVPSKESYLSPKKVYFLMKEDNTKKENI